MVRKDGIVRLLLWQALMRRGAQKETVRSYRILYHRDAWVDIYMFTKKAVYCGYMESAFLKMDIFFLVTTITVALIGLFVAVVAFYVVRILRDINEITRTVSKEAKEFASDFRSVRTDIKEGVSDARESVQEGIDTAKNYTKMVAGAGIVRGVAGFFEALSQEKQASKRRRSSRKKASE